MPRFAPHAEMVFMVDQIASGRSKAISVSVAIKMEQGLPGVPDNSVEVVASASSTEHLTE